MKLIGSLLILSIFGVCTHACEIEAYKQCVEAFATKHPNARNEVIPGFEEHEFDQVCSDYDTLVTCADPTIQGCSEADQITWEAVKDGLDYMCGPRTRSVMKTDATCLKSDQLLQAVRSCNRTAMTEMAHINRGGEGDVCKVLANYERCASDMAEAICGSRVSDWITGMNDVVMKQAKKLAECGQLPAYVVYCGVAGGCIVLVGLVVFVVKMCGKRNKKQHNNPYGKMDA